MHSTLTRRTVLTAAAATPALAIPATAETTEGTDDLLIHRFWHLDRDWCALVDPTGEYVYSSIYLLADGRFVYADWCGREMFVTRCNPTGWMQGSSQDWARVPEAEFKRLVVGPVVWHLRKDSEGRWITVRR